MPSHGFLLENLCRPLEMAHDQSEKMQSCALRFEELVELETPFEEALLLIKDLLRHTFDQQIVASLKDVHRGTVLVEGQVTHRGCKLPGWPSPDRARTRQCQDARSRSSNARPARRPCGFPASADHPARAPG